MNSVPERTTDSMGDHELPDFRLESSEIAAYIERSTTYFELASRKAELEAELSDAELATNVEYAAINRRLATVRDRVDASLEAAFDSEGIETVFDEVLS